MTAPRAVCPGCGQASALLASGAIRQHKGRTRSSCPGVGQLAPAMSEREARLYDVPEASLQLSILEIAGWRGWEAVHWRALQDKRGRWSTGVEGSLGAGWPDLTLVRARDRRLVFAELKRQGEDPSPAQERVLAVLGALAVPPEKAIQTSVEVYVWRPSDLEGDDDSVIGRVLR